MSRGGINNYYLNGNEVQKKQMIDILMPLGLGTNLFLIINQGSVDKILNLDPNQLCQILLESLGYGNYKAERTELELKIVEKEQQIEISQEELKKKNSQLETLYKDLKVYNIYVELSNKIDLLHKELTVRKFNELKEKRVNLEKERVNLEKEYNKIINYKKENEANYLNLKKISEDIENEISTKISIVKVINDEIHETEIIIERLDGQMKLLKSKLDSNINSINSRKSEMEEITLENREKIQRLKSLKELLPDILKERDTNELVNILNNFEKNLLESEKNNLLFKELESKRITLNHFINEFNVNNSSLKKISAKLDEKQKELAILEETFNNNILKLKNLTKLLEKDQLLEEKRLNEKNELISYLTAKVKGVLGFVEDLYSTEEKYKVAVDVALGNYKKSLILESKSELINLKNAVTRINKNINVFALDLIPNFSYQTIKDEILKKYNSKHLIDLINFDSKLTKIFYNLIGNTLLLESFEEAIKMRHNEFFWKFRLVTLNGEIFSNNGQIRIIEKGIKKPVNISEYSELKKSTENLDSKIRRLKEEIHKLTLEQNSLNAQIKIILRERERTEKEINLLESTISKKQFNSQTTHPNSEKIFHSLRENLQLIFELNKLNEKIQINRDRISKINKELEILENENEEINKELDAINRAITEKREFKESSVNRKKILEKEINNLKEQQFKYQKTNFIAESNELAQKESELLKKIFEINNKMELLESKLSELVNNNVFLKDNFDTNKEIAGDKSFKNYSTNELQNTFTTLLKQRDELGPINFKVKENYEKLKEEILEQDLKLKSIKEILKESKLALKSLDNHVNNELTNFVRKINEKLESYFKKIFGSDASLVSTKDPITNGVLFEIKLPGRKFLNMNTLSGGERAMISILLYVSLMENNQTPFCYFDEVDASLDEANLERFVNLLNILKNKKQLIVVTHQRITMEAADYLIGISKNMEGEISCITTKR